MKIVLQLASVGEIATGLALLIVPSLVGRLLFGEELAGVAIPLARVLGVALVGLGVACWPGWTAICGMLTYSLLATAFLTSLGIRGQSVGPLLWLAVVLHSVLTVALWRSWMTKRKIDKEQKQRT